MDRRDPPKLAPVLGLMVAFAAWMVVSTYVIAVLPDDAQAKHSWAFKTVVFALLIPFIFRSRIQIEAFVLVVLAASSGNAMAFAFKMLIGGSFYGQALGLSRSDTGFGESSTFSMVCATLIPLVLFVTRHSVILPNFRYRNVIGVLASLGLVVALLGTHARTGLVALGLLAVLLWFQSRHKMLLTGLFSGAVIFGFPLVLPFLGEKWIQRMDTIMNPTQETSAMGRIAVWEWTWNYVREHPLGGGFEIYRINKFSTTLADGTPFQIAGKAFHSIYFEVLGELGFPGFFMLMAMFALTFATLRSIRKQTRQDPDLAWLHDLAKALTTSLIVYMAGGAFVGIGFQPLHYMWFSLTVAMTNYLRRYLSHQPQGVATGWSRPIPAERALAGPRGGAPEGAVSAAGGIGILGAGGRSQWVRHHGVQGSD